MLNLLFGHVFKSEKLSFSWLWPLVVVVVVASELGFMLNVFWFIPLIFLGLVGYGLFSKGGLWRKVETVRNWITSSEPGPASQVFAPKPSLPTHVSAMPKVVAQAKPQPSDAPFQVEEIARIEPRLTALQLARQGLPRDGAVPRTDPRAKFAALIEAQKLQMAKKLES
ncbi:hypothetical protein C8N43_1928 [Litoreibacter ponti]|uniref:Uncharacterized protein n=1 Tax=Litoreibacter ponti TaxID=1510457 RepID=A0A2T6BMH8_9RHOB|nr:hypothetical protein [Litoreibacter ponti]PTX57261.1 hypothetical protein C8N43_1928 [Litoreibacter ponti]